MPLNIEKRITELLDPLYEMGTIGTPKGWQAVLKEMANIFSSGPAAIVSYSAVNDSFEVMSGTYSQKAISEFGEKLRNVSPFVSGITKMRPGVGFWRKRDRPDSEFLKSEVYRDFFKPERVYDLVYFVLLDHKGSTYGVTFSRPGPKKAFSNDDLECIEVLMPHLSRALRVYLCAQELREENARLTETLSKIPRSILYLDSSARVVYSNDTALRTLAQRDGLELDRNGILFASLSKEERQLKSLLETVFELASESDSHGEVMPISRPSGLRPLQILLSPFHNVAPGPNAAKAALLFVYDPEQNVEAVEAVLIRMYDLTPAEARLAGLIAKGRSLREAGQLLGITQDTVRTHLKRIFAKTRTNRQSDLTTLILNSPAALKNI